MWLWLNSDWAENGTILSARESQSEYWRLKQYSLFICIAKFLLRTSWLDKSSALATGMEVTVEPVEPADDALEPHTESFLATIEEGRSVVGSHIEYRVRRDGVLLDAPVPRCRVRRREWYSIAFACVTNEKRHDAPSTQHMLNKVIVFMHMPSC